MTKSIMSAQAFEKSLVIFGSLIGLLAWGAWLSDNWAQTGTAEARKEEIRARQAMIDADAAERNLKLQNEAMPPVRRFLQAWSQHLSPQSGDQDLAVALRSTLESSAQRKLGLVTDHAVTPEIASIGVQGNAVAVQRVTLRASGESLVALITWLGEAESRFPLARVEHWEIAGTGGKNTALKLTLAQPTSGALQRDRAATDPKSRR